MIHPLIDRLTTELGWPHLEDAESLAAFTTAPGTHVVFVPGDPARNLETPDVAVILPELRMAFQNRFDCAVAGNGIEKTVCELAGAYKTPSLIFFRAGQPIGAIPKVRDWADYMARTTHILAAPAPETAAETA
ncbi:thioredoxin domain-containing protein [Jhaorihella thermophila]|uniref:Hydrogenase expression/formation protein n=1 Tax=Jhaorihella thermophila TaxID=488547 RepID=A0A1H5UJ03_9RHOB|nr:hydrogenase accessory protein [Jhaorihella thermophila]SEF75014.1 hydrogenase-1 operon protein HyaE [Jhaorihella thermophila]